MSSDQYQKNVSIVQFWARWHGLSVCWNPDCRCRRLLPKSQHLPFSGFLPLDISSPAVGDIFRSRHCRCVRCRGSRERNPENERRRDFRRRWHRQSGFQHTNRPRPSSPELFNKDHNAGRESLSHLKKMSIAIINKLSFQFRKSYETG